MVAITDKFGKASAPDAYAPATTVKNVKNAGESTLSAYDLSKFDDTVPLFFITYKKTTHPETGATIRLNQAGWKGLVNKDSNTITNLVLAPGYTDPGQAPGDYIEAIPTSFWANELVDGILVSHNQDGSLKNNVVSTAKIGDDQVTTAKIADGAVTSTKIDFASFNNTAVFGSNSMSVTFVAPFDAIADVSGGSNGWGSAGGLIITNIATPAGLTRVAAEQGNRQGSDGASLPMRGRAVFTGLKKGVSYTFSVARGGAGIGGQSDPSMTAILHQVGV